MKDDEHTSIAYETARLCRLDRSYGCKSIKKYRKREIGRTIVEKVYHVRNEDEDKI